jgi:hypothetical protein
LIKKNHFFLNGLTGLERVKAGLGLIILTRGQVIVMTKKAFKFKISDLFFLPR